MKLYLPSAILRWTDITIELGNGLGMHLDQPEGGAAAYLPVYKTAEDCLARHPNRDVITVESGMSEEEFEQWLTDKNPIPAGLPAAVMTDSLTRPSKKLKKRGAGSKKSKKHGKR